jgi:hypothetical protein
MKIFLKDGGHIRAQDKGKDMRPENIHTETVLQYPRQDSRKDTIAYAEFKVKINDRQ